VAFKIIKGPLFSSHLKQRMRFAISDQ